MTARAGGDSPTVIVSYVVRRADSDDTVCAIAAGLAHDPKFVLTVAMVRGANGAPGRTMFVVEHYGVSEATVDAALAGDRERYRRMGLRIHILPGTNRIVDRLSRRIADGRIAGAVRLSGAAKLRAALRWN